MRIISFIIVIAFSLSLNAQIDMHIFANNQSNDTLILCEGDPINMASAGSVLADDFNTGSLSSALWSANCSPLFSNPCLPSIDGTTYLWVGPAASWPRYLTTIPLNIAQGSQICFDMAYAIQAQSSPCEGPDLPDEGVHLRYSTDGGINWTDINYWPPDDPNCNGSGGYDDCMTTWQNYCENIPSGAVSNTTLFQWYQDVTSSNNYDHWGIDNVIIGDTACTVNWYENGTFLGSGMVLPPLHPTTNTEYTVENICGSVTIHDTLTVIIDTSCILISGYVYQDDNLSCTMDTGEVGVPQVQVMLYDNAVYIGSQWTDQFGYYEFSALPNTGNLNVLVGQFSAPCLGLYCPSSGMYFVDSVSGPMDFALQTVPGFDLAVTGYATAMVPGQTGSIYPDATSLCNDQAGQLILFVDNPMIDIQSTSIPVSSVIGDSLIWDFNIVDDLDGLYLTYITDTTATIGDIICLNFYIEPVNGDLYPANNTFMYCDDVSTSYDPNDKNVSPRGNGQEGFIPPDIPLIYTIRFQNTGTAPAQNIVIIDTLDSNLDHFSINILNQSHDMNVAMYGDILEFRFPNINLPDSGANYQASIGHVTYSIDQQPGLSPGIEIRNKAGIYFDYNAPIITNQTLNTIETPLSIAVTGEFDNNLKVYPNPVNEMIHIEATSQFDLKIVDINGRIILTRSNCNKQSLINISQIKQGIYFVRIYNGQSVETARIIKY